MSGFIMAAQLIAALAILVVIHELGHYIAARMFGIKVEKFYLFFDAGGIKLFKFKKGDTEYGVGWLPLGGYVKIAGMIDESFDKEQMNKPPEPWEFRSKPAWQRLIVMLGGIIMNVVLGVLVFTVLTYSYGETYTPFDKIEHGVYPLELGQQIGLQPGDKILAINGKKPERFEELISADVILGENVTFTILRNGETKELLIPADFARRAIESGIENFVYPRSTFSVGQVLNGSNADKAGLKSGDSIMTVNGEPVKFFDEFKGKLQANKGNKISMTVARDGSEENLTAQVDTNGTIGFAPTYNIPTETEYYGLGKSFTRGSKRAWSAITTTVMGIGKVVKRDIPADKAFQGPIGIAFQFGGEWNWLRFWGLTGLLSMVLAFMNLLPIPALDGGHVVLLLGEMVTGHQLSTKAQEVIQIIGVIILISLMILIFSNDIIQNFF